MLMFIKMYELYYVNDKHKNSNFKNVYFVYYFDTRKTYICFSDSDCSPTVFIINMAVTSDVARRLNLPRFVTHYIFG